MLRQVDAVVVGAGIVGSATAWWLARSGREVVLLEQFEAGHTRGSSHGSVRIFRFAYAEPDYVHFAREALELWRLAEEEAGEVLVELTGGIDLGFEPAVRRVADSLTAAGAPGTWLEAGEAAERFPGFRFSGPVLFSEHGGRCYAARSVAAFARLAAQHGAEVRYGAPVVGIRPDGDGAVVATPDGELRARAVVVAAGAWVSSLLGGIVALPPLRVTEEQPGYFAPVDDASPWPSFIEHAEDTSFATYGLGAPGQGVKLGEHQVGSIVDPDRRPGEPDPRAVERLVERARRLLPGVAPTPIAVEPCLYTTTPTEDFLIDRVGPVTVASACSGHGFKFGPATGRLAAEVAMGALSPPPRFQLPQGQPLPG